MEHMMAMVYLPGEGDFGSAAICTGTGGTCGRRIERGMGKTFRRR
jgi:hypothetical protein